MTSTKSWHPVSVSSLNIFAAWKIHQFSSGSGLLWKCRVDARKSYVAKLRGAK